MPDQYFQNRGNGKDPGQDIEEAIRKFQEKMKKAGPVWIYIVLAAATVLLLSSCFYTVGVDETGVVQRFGKYIRSTPPGLNFKLPMGIEKVSKVKTKFVYKEEFGLRTLKAGKRTKYAPSKAYMGESLMLTGDLNVAVVPWIVQFKIKDERAFLFKVRNVQTTLRDLAEASMRLVVGDRSINEVISKREEIANQAALLLQKELDDAETGLDVVILRTPLVYGPGVKDNFLQLLKVVNRGIPLPFSRVENRRSLIFLDNLTDAIVTCITHPAAAGKTYLVSDEEDVSTPELIRRIAGALGRAERLFSFPPDLIRIAANLVGQSHRITPLLDSLLVDTLKIHNELDWSPPFSQKEGLNQTARWFLSKHCRKH